MLTFYQNLKPQIAKKYRNKLMLQWWAVKQLLKGKLRLRNTFGDEIRVKDEITCWQGDKIQFRTKGHIVTQGLICIVNWISWAGNGVAVAEYGLMSNTGSGWYIRCGTGTGATAQSTTGLVTANSTAPNTLSGTNSNPSAGSYRIAWTATWNSGTLSAITITEFGMWWNNGFNGSGAMSLNAFGNSGYANQSGSNPEFTSRISSTDGDFSSFTVNTSVPLTIQWNLTFTFA
jgi:hypothetical protein